MNIQDENQLFKGAFILTIAGAISKVLSAGYRIPLQNLTGDFGFYIYQQIYPIIGMMMILSLYGFPSAVSKLVAEARSLDKSLTMKDFYFPVFLTLFVVNGLFFSLLWINAETLAEIAGDEQLTTAYRITALSFLLIPLTSFLRGVFQGHYNMLPTSVSQVGKQIVRVLLIIYAAYLFSVERIDAYTIGKVGAIALWIGSFVAIVILSLFLLKKAPTFQKRKSRISLPYIIQTVIIFGMIAVANHLILLIIQFVDMFTLVPNLLKYGLSKGEAMALKGVFDRGQPLIQLGAVLGSSVALVLLPNVAAERVEGNKVELQLSIQKTLVVTLYLSIAATVGLILIYPEANLLLYKDLKGTNSLKVLSGAIFLSSFTIAITAILQGLGDYIRTALYIGLTFILKWALNLLFIPYLSIMGSALATVMSMLMLMFILIRRMKRKFPDFSPFQRVHWPGFLGAVFGMGVILLVIRTFFPYQGIENRTVLFGYVLLIIFIGVMVYSYLLYRFSAFQHIFPRKENFKAFLGQLLRGRDTYDTSH